MTTQPRSATMESAADRRAGPADDDHALRKTRRWMVWLFVAVGVMVFCGANAHLVYVAFQSQPDCVVHSKVAGQGGSYSAAKSAC